MVLLVPSIYLEPISAYGNLSMENLSSYLCYLLTGSDKKLQNEVSVLQLFS